MAWNYGGGGSPAITHCIINGQKMRYDLMSSKNKDAYKDWKRPVRYLGEGHYVSPNGTVSQELGWFWVYAN